MYQADVQLNQRSGVKLSFFSMPVYEYMECNGVAGCTEKDTTHYEDTVGTIKSISNNITIIKGVVDSNRLEELGRLCGVEDLRQRHQYGSPAAFPIGTLPSRQRHSVTIRFITIGSYRQVKDAPQDIYADVQSEVSSQLEEHHKDCRDGRRNNLETFRAVTLLGQASFAAEQQAVFFVYDPSGSDSTNNAASDFAPSASNHDNRASRSRKRSLWSGVLLTDIGTPSGGPPWKTSRSGFKEGLFLSVGASDMNTARFGQPNDPGTLTRPDPFQSRKEYGMRMAETDYDTCAQEPFVFAADLLETSAHCYDQALNFVRHMLQEESGLGLPDDVTHVEERMAVLGRVKKLLDSSIRYFAETISTIDGHSQLGWDSGPCSEDLAANLRGDFAHLLEDAKEISSICQEAVRTTMTNINVRASQETLRDGKRIKVITYLAFYFAPLSFLSSVFGMNVAELEKNNPSLELFGYLAGGTAVLSVALLFLILNWSDGVHLKEKFVTRTRRWLTYVFWKWPF